MTVIFHHRMTYLCDSSVYVNKQKESLPMFQYYPD